MMDMYVAGEWQKGTAVTPVTHPYSGKIVDEVAIADERQIEAALAAAVEGARSMRALSAYERQELLRRAADLVERAAEEFAQTISLESGKPLAEARAEAGRAADLIHLSATEGARLHGETVPVDAAAGNADKFAFTVHQPCGVVVAICPFNYPLLLVLHKLAPALAAGNAVIVKPAEQTPLTALKLTGVFLKAGFPEHALQCITGPGDPVGRMLCADERVRKISFTGSSAVGERITRVAGVKKLSLELGSNAPMIVLSDADMDISSEAAARGGYANAGQVCVSVQRILVDRSRYADFLDALRPRVEGIAVGDPFSDGTAMSALISQDAAQRVERVIRNAVEGGASLLTGGQRDGAVLKPAIVADVQPDMDVSAKELFGPAVAVTPVDGIAEAIRIANDTTYGLAAGIFTTNITNALRFAREVDAGNIQINSSPLWRADLMPYGGLKQSGIGKEGPRYAVEEMTESKTVVIHGLS